MGRSDGQENSVNGLHATRDHGLNFVDIAKKIGGISGQDAAKAWLMVKDAREAYANREKGCLS